MISNVKCLLHIKIIIALYIMIMTLHDNKISEFSAYDNLYYFKDKANIE